MSRRQRLDTDWLCHVGELDAPPGRGSSKAGACGGASDLVADELRRAEPEDDSLLERMIPGFADARVARPQTLGDGWRSVHLPHDWRIEQTPTPTGPIWQAFLPGGVAWYRRRFPAVQGLGNGRMRVEFDGVMRDATVWLNGFLLGTHLSGYTPFEFDVTDIVRRDGEEDNVLLVRTDTTTAEGWWYEGGGIYRSVWLSRTDDDVHVDRREVWVTTTVAHDAATVHVEVPVVSHRAEATDVELTATVERPDGTTADAATFVGTVQGLDRVALIGELVVKDPDLWEVGEGRLHRLQLRLHVDNDQVDEFASTFGVRTVELDPTDGLLVNGRRTPVHGANLHQGFAGVGAAETDTIIEHKLSIMVEMGCNAIRTAHHPPGPVLLDAADRLGLLVIAENRLLSTAGPYLEDLRSLIVNARNHPSVFLWSLENEEYLQATDQGKRLLRALVKHVSKLDPTRATTVGAPRDFDSDYFDLVDVVGMHYQSLNQLIDDVHLLRPNTPHLATEEGLNPTVRGQYEDDPDRGLASSFGTSMGLYGAFPAIVAHLTGRDPIEYDHGATWQWFADHPESGGGFVWAGIDFLGEPTPMQWPVHISNYGAVDLCGFPKDYYWLLRSFFRVDPLVHVMPHWTWPGQDGKPIRTWVLSNADEIEVRVNGRTIGRRPVIDHIARWDDGIPYEAGTLEARGLRDGVVVAEHVQRTAGPEHRVHLDVTHGRTQPDGTVLVSASIVDAHGNVCPWAEHQLVFDVAGPAEVIGVGNGDPTSLESHRGNRRRAFHGRALAIVRTQPGCDDIVHLRARADNLIDGTVDFATPLPLEEP